MKFCISFGKFELKYFFYCILFIILEITINYFVYYDEGENIITDHCLLHSFCFFLGYLLNFIPARIFHIRSNKKENPITNKLNEENNYSIEYIYNQPYEKYLSTKDIIKFLLICFILLLADLIENTGIIIDDNDNDDYEHLYDDSYIFIEFIIIFLVSIFSKEVYYMHQYISFFILFLIELIKNIYFFIIKKFYKFNPISFVLNIIYCIFYAIYYLYIKKLMNNKFISPYKCNFMIGVINVPIIILMYLIISFTSLGNDNNEYYYDNIFELFKDLGKIDIKSAIILLSLPFFFGIYAFIVIRIINDYSIFHMYIPFLIQYFIENIIQNFEFIEAIFLKT